MGLLWTGVEKEREGWGFCGLEERKIGGEEEREGFSVVSKVCLRLQVLHFCYFSNLMSNVGFSTVQQSLYLCVCVCVCVCVFDSGSLPRTLR